MGKVRTAWRILRSRCDKCGGSIWRWRVVALLSMLCNGRMPSLCMILCMLALLLPALCIMLDFGLVSWREGRDGRRLLRMRCGLMILGLLLRIMVYGLVIGGSGLLLGRVISL